MIVEAAEGDGMPFSTGSTGIANPETKKVATEKDVTKKNDTEKKKDDSEKKKKDDADKKKDDTVSKDKAKKTKVPNPSDFVHECSNSLEIVGETHNYYDNYKNHL